MRLSFPDRVAIFFSSIEGCLTDPWECSFFIRSQESKKFKVCSICAGKYMDYVTPFCIYFGSILFIFWTVFRTLVKKFKVWISTCAGNQKYCWDNFSFAISLKGIRWATLSKHISVKFFFPLDNREKRSGKLQNFSIASSTKNWIIFENCQRKFQKQY